MDECIHTNFNETKDLKTALNLSLNKNRGSVLSCVYCDSTFMMHVCLTCEKLACFKDSHFRRHYKDTNHNLALNLNKQIVFCFICNKYISLFCIKDLKTTTHNTEDLFTNDTKMEHAPNTNIIDIMPKRLYKRYPWGILKGFTNLGNSCYLNSLFSILLNLKPFKDYFLNLMHTRNNCRAYGCVICDIYDIYREVYSKSGCIILSNLILTLTKKSDDFLGSKQYDVHELYIKLLDYINDIDDRLSNVFNGVYKITSKCERCENYVELNEKFLNLSLQLGDDIQSMLNNFFREETVEGIYCQNCSYTGTISKNYILTKHSDVLALQIKRFEYKDKKIIKMGNNILINEQITIENVNYQLFGSIIHDGAPHNGHYRSYLRIDDQYMSINDDTITTISVDDALCNASYLIFYVNLHNH